MGHSSFAPCVCQACAVQVKRLNRQYDRCSDLLVQQVSIDAMLSITNEMDALNRARHRVLHGCTHLN